MQIFKLIVASFLIPLGLIFWLSAATELISPTNISDNPWGKVAGGLILGSIPLFMGGWFMWEWYRERRRELYRRQRHKRSVFLHLIRDHRGLVTVSSLAKAANISPQEAQAFLDRAVAKYHGNSPQLIDGEYYYLFDID
ncbi:MAG: hypothetical protein P5702_14665 [Limnospira sp. PMC 1291.21]|uniref:Uncharacterized protein n=3 Tax=Limnospira TaxID=2596745 RepID=B5VYL1_LIMMA|nr:MULTISPECIES: hypothetical protein [Limnospira]EKD06961.1 hypothetical protein SPLC1_S510750 [Arthrospira platensis C1]MDC0840640.1 hypothetical protein [Limnoraphis robusta]MDY7053647.1 hypothetical protein [Limnospira fusiformis LS22]QJB26202.1 hypothetical protein HFV01_10870 [Limnospira fusiformis SAG 85.79]EDZ95631.1 hypothetical protein AmaxDRAFT_1603 [Limnospira maxima CS-328]